MTTRTSLLLGMLLAPLLADARAVRHADDAASAPAALELDFDCPSLGLNIGDPCDDGDPCTVGSTVDASCNCNGGTPTCDDGDPCTTDLCVVPGLCSTFENGSGTADLPSPFCTYACAPGQLMHIVDGLPPGSPIDIVASMQNFVCIPSMTFCTFSTPDCMQNDALLRRSCRRGSLVLQMQGTGVYSTYSRLIAFPVQIEMHHETVPTGTPVQDMDAVLQRMSMELLGDPDFDLLRITGGNDFGLPSPGHTTLVQLPGGNWAVDSFFDITYRVDFVGAPAGPFTGMSGSTTLTVRMQTDPGTTPVCFNTPLCDDGNACTTDECIVPGLCTSPDNGAGSAVLPAPGCTYIPAPADDMQIIDGLPPGTTIDIHSVLQNIVCGASCSSGCDFTDAAGNHACRDATLVMPLVGTGTLAGFSRLIPIPVNLEMVHELPAVPGAPIQVRPGTLLHMNGQIIGDPDFDLLRITAGSSYGMPSPGHTTLVQAGGGNYHVDSFFDITYRIDFVGTPGGPLAGMSGSTTATIRMGNPAGPGPAVCLHTPVICDDGDPCTTDSCDPLLGCVFTPIDADGDLIPDCVDECPGDPLNVCHVIPAGSDCFTTSCGSTFIDFGGLPIPPGFFDPGSEPFTGIVVLGGATPGGTDTQVQRLGPLDLSGPLPASDAVPIEIVSLNLTSCNPIEVRYCDGSPTETWDVHVGQSAVPGPPGTMSATRTHPNGGHFTSNFFVRPVFTFTRISDLTVRVIDTGLLGFPPLPMQGLGAVPWVHVATLPLQPTPCGVNFVPGVLEAGVPPIPGSSCTSTVQCTRPVGHAGPGHMHVTGYVSTPCPCGACIDPGTGACTEVSGAMPGTICAGMGGFWAGEGSSCASNDGDAIPDAIEDNGRCLGTLMVAPTTTSSPTDPTRADTDGDGLNDDVDPFPTNRCLPVGAPLRPAICDAFDATIPGDGDADDDGLSDLCEILGGGRLDCNMNGVPDEDEGGFTCTTDLDFVYQADGYDALTWQIFEQGTSTLMQSGGGMLSGNGSEATCLPDGCFYLVVTDGGGDGIVSGGYLLKVNSAARLIDNLHDAYGQGGFASGATSAISGNEGFCLPVGSDRLIYTSCDKMDWFPNSCGNTFIVANDNPAVSAQYGVNNANSGYQFWFYNPNGGYSFKRFRSHAVSEGFTPLVNNVPQPQLRAAHCKLNNWASGNHLQDGVFYNVKVRGRINGANNTWGPACRMMLNSALFQCPRTKLMDIPNNQYLSCGQQRAIGTNVYVHARPVKRFHNGCNWLNANRYQFRFRIPAEFITIVKTSAVGQYFVNTNGLACGKTYEVEVRASFDGGSTWCHGNANPNVLSPQWGDVCLLTTACGGEMAQEGGGTSNAASEARATIYPNPNRGDQLFVSLSSVEEGVSTVSVDIYDSFGKRVAQRNLAVSDGFANSVLDLNGLANGMYLVSIGAGSAIHTERLVIQR
jgi:hypothetical protein